MYLMFLSNICQRTHGVFDLRICVYKDKKYDKENMDLK